jgi:hypothetical protein
MQMNGVMSEPPLMPSSPDPKPMQAPPATIMACVVEVRDVEDAKSSEIEFPGDVGVDDGRGCESEATTEAGHCSATGVDALEITGMWQLPDPQLSNSESRPARKERIIK